MSSEKRLGDPVDDVESKRQKQQIEHNFDLYTLRHFYQTLFPAEEFVQWLTYAHGKDLDTKEDLMKRELSFTLEGDCYLRYRGFSNANDLRRDLVHQNPIKIDIGGMYNLPMTMKSSSTFKPLSRELIFDIDMDDYSPIRHCCTGASICQKCWLFMNNAMMVLKKILNEEFGFKHILFVYSGRRGVHIWVCDKRARVLTDDQRKAIVDYLSFSRTSQVLSYSLLECADDLRPFFEETMIAKEGQDVLSYDPSKDVSTKNHRDIFEKYQNQRFLPLLECLPSQFSINSKDKLIHILTSDSEPIIKWNQIQSLFKDDTKNTIAKIILTYTYPRLDKNVSLLRHHLLKSPFIVHPKSCRFCCPIDPDHVMEFDPFAVPYLDEVFENEDKMNTFKSYIQLFKEGFLQPLQKECVMEDNLNQAEEVNKEELF